MSSPEKPLNSQWTDQPARSVNKAAGGLIMAPWGAAGARAKFLRQFSHYLFRYATWIPPLIWFNTYVAEVTFIRGPSMYPFLNPQYNESLRKDLCLVWKLYAHEDLKRGMVVTFR